MKCMRCGDETQGTYSEGGILRAICVTCDWKEQVDLELERRKRAEKYLKEKLPNDR